MPDAPSAPKNDQPANVPRDWRAVIVTLAGFVVVLGVVLAVIVALPGDIPKDTVNTKGQSLVSIGTAALTAVSAVVAAYFGVKAANVAREDAEKRSEAHAIQVAHLAGAADPAKADQALDKAMADIRGLRSA